MAKPTDKKRGGKPRKVKLDDGYVVHTHDLPDGQLHRLTHKGQPVLNSEDPEEIAEAVIQHRIDRREERSSGGTRRR